MNTIVKNLRMMEVKLRQGIFNILLAFVLLGAGYGVPVSAKVPVSGDGLDIMAIDANTEILGTPFSYYDILLGISNGKVVIGFDFVTLDLITEKVKFRTVFECLQIVGNTSIERWHTADSTNTNLMPNNVKGMGSVTAPDFALGLFYAPAPLPGVKPCSIVDLQTTMLNPVLAPYVSQLKLTGKVIVIDGAKPNF